MRMMRLTGRRAVGEVDSVYAWLRLLAGVLTSTIGGVGMWSIAVVLPTLQADFGVTRADVSLAYTAVAGGRSCAREPGSEDVAIHGGARAADRRWYLGQFRTGYRRHLDPLR